MITKKKVLSHILWGGIFGGIFGFISGNIISYELFYGDHSIYFLLKDWFHLNLREFEKINVCNLLRLQRFLLFLIPGLFLGLSLGVADKSRKKIIYGTLGGLVGGLIFYAVVQIFRESFSGPIILIGFLLAPVFYISSICIALGILYKSFHKAIKGLIGGGIALLAISPLMFLIFIVIGLSVESAYVFRNVIAALLIGYIILGVSLTPGIFIGIESGDKKNK